MTVFARQDGIHLEWRRKAGLDGGRSSWTVEDVKDLRAVVWDSETNCREQLGNEFTSLKAEAAVVETLCMKTGTRLMYRTLGPDSWDLVLA